MFHSRPHKLKVFAKSVRLKFRFHSKGQFQQMKHRQRNLYTCPETIEECQHSSLRLSFPFFKPLVTPFAFRTTLLGCVCVSDFVQWFPLIVGQTTDSQFSAKGLLILINICISTSRKVFSNSQKSESRSQNATKTGPAQTLPKLQGRATFRPGGTVLTCQAPKGHLLPSFLSSITQEL